MERDRSRLIHPSIHIFIPTPHSPYSVPSLVARLTTELGHILARSAARLQRLRRGAVVVPLAAAARACPVHGCATVRRAPGRQGSTLRRRRTASCGLGSLSLAPARLVAGKSETRRTSCGRPVAGLGPLHGRRSSPCRGRSSV